MKLERLLDNCQELAAKQEQMKAALHDAIRDGKSIEDEIVTTQDIHVVNNRIWAVTGLS